MQTGFSCLPRTCPPLLWSALWITWVQPPRAPAGRALRASVCFLLNPFRSPKQALRAFIRVEATGRLRGGLGLFVGWWVFRRLALAAQRAGLANYDALAARRNPTNSPGLRTKRTDMRPNAGRVLQPASHLPPITVERAVDNLGAAAQGPCRAGLNAPCTFFAQSVSLAETST